MVTIGARQFQVRITWGALTDMYIGAGVATAALTLQTSIRETKEHEGSPEPEIRRLYRYTEQLYPASKVDRIPLDPDVLYKGILIRSESLGDLSTSVINNVRVQVGTEVVFDLPAPMLVDANTQDNEWSMPSGYYFVDFAPAASGLTKVSDFLDLHGRNDAYLILDVNGGATNKVQLLSHEFQVLHNAVHFNREVHGH